MLLIKLCLGLVSYNKLSIRHIVDKLYSSGSNAFVDELYSIESIFLPKDRDARA